MQILLSLILMLSIQSCYADISLNSSIQYAVDSNTKHQYLEGSIPNEAVEPYLKHLKTILSPEDYKNTRKINKSVMRESIILL
ncbi:MAG: hypothetical protein ACE1S7_00230 [Candidatus Tisiphia sp.]